MTNTTQATAAGKVAAGAVKGSERSGAVLAKGTKVRGPWHTHTPAAVLGIIGCLPLAHASLEARALAFATDAGGCDLIAEIEGRCARTRRPL